jgi:hypothetical protein
LAGIIFTPSVEKLHHMLSQAANYKQELAVMQNFDKKKETEKASIQKLLPESSSTRKDFDCHFTLLQSL